MMLVERDDELALLQGRFEDCVRGTGSVVLIAGNVASGKTELLDTFSRWAGDAGALTLSAAGSHAESGLPFGAIGQLLAAAGVDPALIDDMMADGQNIGPAQPASAAIERKSAEVLRWVCSTLLALSRTRPVLVTIDDVHLCDPFSFQAIHYLVRRMRSARLLVVVTELGCPQSAAPAFEADLMGQPHCTRLSLAPLTQVGVQRLLRDQIGPEAATRLAERCREATGGNPLLVRAIAADQRAAGATRPAASSVELVVGDAFGQAVIDYLYRCPAICRVVAQAAAVLDTSTSPARISRLTGVDSATAERTLTSLRRGGLLNGTRFRTAMARTAILDNINVAEASILHRRAAEALHADAGPPLELARFLLAADDADLSWAPATLSWAPSTLRAAAETALDLGETAFAADCLRMAYRCCADERERTLITATLARAEWRTDPSHASRHFDDLLEGIRRGYLTGRDALMLIRWILWYGRADDAIQAFDEIAGRSDGSDPEFAADLIFTQASVTYMYPAQRLQNLPPTWAAATDAITGSQVYGAGVLQAVLTGGFDESSVIKIEQVLHRTPLDDSTLALLTTALTALLYADEFTRAVQWCERLSEQAAARRAPAWQAILSALQGAIAMRQGDLSGATRHVRAAFELLQPAGWGVAVGLPLSTMLFAVTATGQYEEAARLLGQPIPEAMFRSTFGLPYLHARGNFYLATGRWHAALDDFQTCGRLMNAWQIDEPTFVPWRTEAAQALLRLGQSETARSLVEDQLERIPAGRSPTRGLTLRVKAATSSGTQKLALIAEAVQILETTGDRLELARALTDMVHAQQELGAVDESRQTFGRAWAVACECRAEALSRSLLPYLDGVEAVEDSSALSEAEQRVADLAARGLKNREIARELFITVSTVEQHLTRVYRKLEVTRRAELASRLWLVAEERQRPRLEFP